MRESPLNQKSIPLKTTESHITLRFSVIVRAYSQGSPKSVIIRIFHLDLVQCGPSQGEVILEKPDFVRYGSANSWLMSDIFKLRHPYSTRAEQAMEDAKKLQLKDRVSQGEVQEVSERLIKYLPAHDTFWSRWTFFAEKHGAEL